MSVNNSQHMTFRYISGRRFKNCHNALADTLVIHEEKDFIYIR